MPQSPFGGGSMVAPMPAVPSFRMVLNSLRSIDSAMALRMLALSNGGLLGFTIRLTATPVGKNWQTAFGACDLTSFISGAVMSVGNVRSNSREVKARMRVERVSMLLK